MIDPDELDDLLEVLIKRHVASFECPEFSVTLHAAAPAEVSSISRDIKEGNAAVRKPQAHGLYSHPSLWANGAPPSFPRTTKAAETEAIRESDYEGEF